MYGVIEVPRWRGWEDAMKHNSAAIDALPDEGEWPWLTRGMFAASPERASYRYTLIHFAGAIKSLDEGCDEWIRKFESMLDQIYWITADAHLDTEYCGSKTFSWLADVPKSMQLPFPRKLDTDTKNWDNEAVE